MNMFLIFLAFLIYCVRVQSIEISEHFLDIPTVACLERLKIDKHIVVNNLDENFYLPEVNPELNEFLACSAKSREFLDENGKIKFHILENNIKNIVLPFLNKNHLKETSHEIAEKCKTVEDKNLGVQMVKLHNCIVDSVSNK
ncbi:hypothetical protein FQA39_LY08214 [Lamprigera yunnana]|nr:hypothetical protein FQA39_LY08214 [Lamprigera yunnana]